MAGSAKPITSSFLGLVSGAVALILVTAIIVSAVTSAQVAGDLRHATQQLQDMRESDRVDQAARLKRSEQLQQQLVDLKRQSSAQEKAQQRALADLRKALRSHGIPVPNPPRATVTARPKAQRRSTSPANPTPTAPGPRSPSAPTPDPTLPCQLVPVFCGFGVSLPRLPLEES